jgi:hypothetical protein
MATETQLAPSADPQFDAFCRQTLTDLQASGIPFLVGGALALESSCGIRRRTHDLDIFVLQHDFPQVLAALAERGYRTEVTYSHWLGKAFHDENCLDLIFNSGNGICPVDPEWFAHAVPARLFDCEVQLCPAEEMIWQKSFVMTRERFDGADVAHLLRANCEMLDWERLVRRFGPRHNVLLHHLIAFAFIYPAEQASLPGDVVRNLLRSFREELERRPDPERICRGTLFSSSDYLTDIEQWGYADARLVPHGALRPVEVAAAMAAMPRPL